MGGRRSCGSDNVLKGSGLLAAKFCVKLADATQKAPIDAGTQICFSGAVMDVKAGMQAVFLGCQKQAHQVSQQHPQCLDSFTGKNRAVSYAACDLAIANLNRAPKIGIEHAGDQTAENTFQILKTLALCGQYLCELATFDFLLSLQSCQFRSQ